MIVNEKQKKVRSINDEWMGSPGEYGTIAGDCGDDCGFYMHEPFAFRREDGSEFVPYWDERHKIVFCNLNAWGGLPTDEYHTFSWDIFTQGYHRPGGTTEKTALLCYCLRKRLAGEVPPEADALPGIFRNERAQVDDAMRRVCYMNIYPIVASGADWTKPNPAEGNKSPCDWAWDFYQGSPVAHCNRYFQRKLIAALEPDIFITTGIGKDAEGDFSGGFDLLNRIYQQKDAPDADAKYRYTGEELWLGRPNKDNGYVTFQYLETSPGKKTLFAAARHPGRLGYADIADIAERVARAVLRGAA